MPSAEPDQSTRRLLIVSDCAHGGTFHVATLLAEGLRTTFAISFAAPFAGESAPAEALRRLGIEVLTTALSYENLDRSSFARDEAAEMLAAARPDLILCVDGAELSSLLAVKTVARHRSIPYVTIINLLSEDALTRFAPFLDESVAALHSAAAVVFVSEASRRRCHALLPDLPMASQAIVNSVEAAFFTPPGPATRQRVRRSLGIADDALVCLTTARIETRKGQAIGVDALARLKAEGRLGPLHWLLAGRSEAWDRDRLEEAMQAAGVADRFTLLGERKDVRDLLDASDLFILTSYAEGMPLSIIEALARGVPAIATAIDGIVEQIDESCGVLLPAPGLDRDACVAGLADALAALQDDRARLDRMRAAARARARTQFHPEIGVARYRALLTGIAPRAPATSADWPAEGLRVGTSLDFAAPELIWNHLQDGWARCEADGVWTDGLASTLRLELAPSAVPLRLTFDLTPYPGRRNRTTRLFVGDRLAGTWRTRGKRMRSGVTIAAGETGRPLTLRFENPGATRPCDIGRGSDWRQLALFVRRLDIDIAPKPSLWSGLMGRLRAAT